MDGRVVVAVLLLVGAGAATLGTPTAAQSASPQVSVTVDGAPLDLGEVHHTPTDPWLTVTATAPEGATLQLVEIRVDGETRHVFEPSTRSVDRNMVLNLRNGDHRLTVVAKGSGTDGGVTTYAATVVRDDRAPSVTFAPPLRGAPLGFDTATTDRPDAEGPLFVVDGTPTASLTDAVPTTTVTNSTLDVAGTISDDSEIRAVRIEHAYEYATVGGRSADDDEEFGYDPVDVAPIHPDRPLPSDDVDGDADPERLDRYFFPSPGDSFDQRVTLALGTNYLRIAVEDVLGNIAVYHVVVTVEDGTPPSVTLTDVRYVSPTRLHVEGTVTDEVQVHDVWLEETLLTLDDVATDVDVETFDGADLCSAATELDLDNRSQLCTVYDDATVAVREETNELVVRHRVVYRRPTVPDADRKRVSFDTTVYHPPDADEVEIAANDTALNDRNRSYPLSTFLRPNVTVAEGRTGYVQGRTVSVGGRITGGQPASASVETLDPETGRLIDIQSVTVGPEGQFGTRLAGARGTTDVRIRVRDASGAEYLHPDSGPLTVTAPAPDPAPPPERPDGTPTPAAGDAGDATTPDGFRIPLLGVVVPTPGPLGAAATVPVPFVGPIDVPLVPVGLATLLAAAVALRRR
jgi:hypothetical protein